MVKTEDCEEAYLDFDDSEELISAFFAMSLGHTSLAWRAGECCEQERIIKRLFVAVWSVRLADSGHDAE